MASRRSTRSQGRRPLYENDENVPVGQPSAHDVNMMMMGMGGSWQMGMGHHVPTVDGYYNMGYPYHHNTHQYPHQFQTQYPHQFQPQYPPQFHPNSLHHPVDNTQTMPSEDEPGPSSGRTLRARPARGQISTSSAPTASTSTANMMPPTPAGCSQATESAGEDADDDEDDNVDDSGTAKPKKAPGMETAFSIDQMVQNCLYYLLLTQHKKVPVKRSDLVKNAMNSQHKSFQEVMKKLETALEEVFGMKLVKLEKGKDNQHVACPTLTSVTDEVDLDTGGNSSAKKGRGKGASSAPSYIVVSKFPSSVCDSVTERDPEVDSKKTVLYLILATIFMLNRPIDEELIWKIIKEMQLNQMVCQKREDLRKFLKSEFVSPGYLNIELSTNEHSYRPNSAKRAKESASADQGDKGDQIPDQAGARYCWGPRAHMEYSKYHMLKFVAGRFPGRNPYEFTVQYNIIKKQEKELIDKDLVEERDNGGESENLAAAAENGSALQIRQRTRGRESFVIDTGDNTETETEG